MDPQVVERFERALVARDASANTVSAYLRDLGAFAAWCARAHTDPIQVDADGVRRYLASRVSLGKARSSVARSLSALRTFGRFLVREGIRADDPYSLVGAPKGAKTLPRTVKRRMLDAILEAPDASTPTGLRNRAILELLYAAGLRVAELCSLDVDDADRASRMLRVTGKGRKQRIIPIGEPCVDALDRYLSDARALLMTDRSPGGALFVNARGKRLGTRDAYRIVAAAARKASPGLQVHPHMFRHTFATDLLDGDADLRSVQELLGHADLRTTQVYTHVSTERLRRTYDRAHPHA